MQYLSRSRLPVFTPRLDLTAEDLNAQAETICAALNELAGRLFIIKDMIPEEERSQYAEESSYPILDEIQRIWDDIQRAWDTITKNKQECEEHYQETMERITELDQRLNNLIQAVKQELLNTINAVDKKHDDEEERIEDKFDISFSDLEKRFNALDDAAARKADVATLFDRIRYIQENSLPNIGRDGYWYIGKIKTDTLARGPQGDKGETGDSGVYIGQNAPTNGANVWIDPDGEGDDTSVDYGLDSGVKVCEEGELEENAEAYNSTYGAIITKVPYSLDAVETTADSGFDIDADIDEHTHIKATMDVATKELSTTVTNIGEESRMFWDVKVSSEPVATSLVMGVQTTLQPRSSKTIKKVLTSEEFETLSTSPEPILYTAQHCEELNNENSREKITVGGVEVLTNSSKDNSVHYMYPTYIEEGKEIDANTNKLVCVYAAGTEAKPENVIDVYCMGKKIGSGSSTIYFVEGKIYYETPVQLYYDPENEYPKVIKDGYTFDTDDGMRYYNDELGMEMWVMDMSGDGSEYMVDDMSDGMQYLFELNSETLEYNAYRYDHPITGELAVGNWKKVIDIYTKENRLPDAKCGNANLITFNLSGSQGNNVKIYRFTFSEETAWFQTVIKKVFFYGREGRVYYNTDTEEITSVIIDGEGTVNLTSPYSDSANDINNSVLTVTNSRSYTPSKNYHPATKKYVDDTVANASGGGSDMVPAVFLLNRDNPDLEGLSTFLTKARGLFVKIGTLSPNGSVYSEYITTSKIPTSTSGSGTIYTKSYYNKLSYACYNYYHYNKSTPIQANSPKFSVTYSADKITVTAVGESFQTTSVNFSTTDSYALSTSNNREYTPTADYHPATKKYVDNAVANAGSGSGDTTLVGLVSDNSLSKGYWLNTDNNKERLLTKLKAVYDTGEPIVIATSGLLNDTNGYGVSVGEKIFTHIGQLKGTAATKLTFYELDAKNYGSIAFMIEVNLSTALYMSSCVINNIIVKSADGSQLRTLSTNNTNAYTPTGDYNPATKKYVDDLIGDINTVLDNIIGGE